VVLTRIFFVLTFDPFLFALRGRYSFQFVSLTAWRIENEGRRGEENRANVFACKILSKSLDRWWTDFREPRNRAFRTPVKQCAFNSAARLHGLNVLDSLHFDIRKIQNACTAKPCGCFIGMLKRTVSNKEFGESKPNSVLVRFTPSTTHCTQPRAHVVGHASGAARRAASRFDQVMEHGTHLSVSGALHEETR
jgi:hypothetical protein